MDVLPCHRIATFSLIRALAEILGLIPMLGNPFSVPTCSAAREARLVGVQFQEAGTQFNGNLFWPAQWLAKRAAGRVIFLL